MEVDMKKLINFFFPKYYIMSVYKDENGNLFGGIIHKNDGKSYVDNVSYIKNPEYLGITKIKFV